MFKHYSSYFVISIFIFHVLASVYATYSLFSDFSSWTIFHVYPIVLWLFTFAWGGIFLKKRWCAFAYFMLTFFELANRLFFGKFDYGEVFGNILFPINLVFAFVILALYRLHFGDRSNTI
jgi:hypothetical protein